MLKNSAGDSKVVEIFPPLCPIPCSVLCGVLQTDIKSDGQVLKILERSEHIKSLVGECDVENNAMFQLNTSNSFLVKRIDDPKIVRHQSFGKAKGLVRIQQAAPNDIDVHLTTREREHESFMRCSWPIRTREFHSLLPWIYRLITEAEVIEGQQPNLLS